MSTLTKKNIPNTQETEPLSIVKQQLVVSVLMTKFSQDPNPKLSHLLVSQLYLLIEHPEVNRFPDCKQCYLELQKEWQQTTEMLLGQREKQADGSHSVH